MGGGSARWRRVQVYDPTKAGRDRCAAEMREFHGIDGVAVDDPAPRPSDRYLAYVARPKDRSGRCTGTGETAVPPGWARAWSASRRCWPGATTVRAGDGDITFAERGTIQGAQFFAVAGLVYELARERGMGQVMSTSWSLQDIRD
jgi:alanine dehydrogenase